MGTNSHEVRLCYLIVATRRRRGRLGEAVLIGFGKLSCELLVSCFMAALSQIQAISTRFKCVVVYIARFFYDTSISLKTRNYDNRSQCYALVQVSDRLMMLV